MIVVIKMKDDEIKKAFIRNSIFHEVDTTNKRLSPLTTSKVDSVFWIDKNRTMIQWPVKEWIAHCEENNYWGIS